MIDLGLICDSDGEIRELEQADSYDDFHEPEIIKKQKVGSIMQPS